MLDLTINGDAVSVLQLRGVNSGSTPGGSATADLRTVYAYSPDGTGGSANYEGSVWPYVTTDRDISELVIDWAQIPEDPFPEFTKNDENHILINGRPAYQYSGDTSSSDATGNANGNVWWLFDNTGETLQL